MAEPNSGERAAHDELRDAIRAATVQYWQRQIRDDDEDAEMFRETLPEVERGLLVDYAVVAIFDAGEEHTIKAVLRTDGWAPSYRVVGLLQQALNDGI